MKTHSISRIAGALIVALGLSTSVMADDTSSSIRGSILTPAGDISANAKVEILHEPSGTRTVATTNESGAFSSKGLRVGGPYTIKITGKNGFSIHHDIYLTLGETFRLSTQLEPMEDIERISVTGSSALFDPSKGSSSTFSGDALSKSSSFNRDLKDIVKQNPLAVVGNDGNTLSLAGSNPRYNSLAVDGVNLNDDFGLAGNGYPTERSPISFDSIEQISVAIAPFTAKEGGFSGGKISVVTKSGTNEFHGSMFIEQAKDSWAGTPEDPDSGDNIDILFDEETWGATFGGPIIKDKLFFFASYETFEAPSSVNTGPADSSVANKVSQVTQSEVDRVISAAQSRYNYNAGNWNDSVPLEDEKYSLKLDWNINDDHRASFAYNHASSNSAGNTTGRSGELYLSSHWYNRANEYDTYVAQLFSYWNDDFSTEAKISYKESVNGQVSLGGYDFGEVKITVPATDSKGKGLINLGSDDSRHANQLSNETLQMRLSGEYLHEDHAISFGWEYEKVDVFNVFMQHYLGSWYFNSIEDFENGVAGSFEYQNNPSLNRDDAAAAFSLGTNTLYIEDAWDVNGELNVTYGLRYERTFNDDTPNLNSSFVERYGFENTENLDGLDLFLPRIGFTWDAAEDLVIRGGAGRFSGGRPNVFISNAFTNDGSRIALYQSWKDSSSERGYLDNADPSGIPQRAQDQVAASVLGGPNSNIDAIDPNFEIPTTWQYSIASDYTADLTDFGLGDDWFISAEVLYKEIEKDLIWSDLSRVLDTSKGNNGLTVDGRPIYTHANADRGNRDVLLSNSSGGHSLIETLSIAKKWDNGLSANFSYAHSKIRDRISATGTSTNTAYEHNPVFDPENPGVGRSSFETKHRFTLNLSYNAELFEGYNSGFHLFWERKSGTPYTWLLDYNDDDGLSGDLDLTGDFLAYIPTGADDSAVVYDNGYSYEQLMTQLDEIGLSTSGGYIEKNSSVSPWTTSVNMRFEQEIPGLLEGHKGIFYVDVQNALAIFDKDSARIYRNKFGTSSSAIVGYSINDAGQYVYSDASATSSDRPVDFLDRESTWSLKIGVKYIF